MTGRGWAIAAVGARLASAAPCEAIVDAHFDEASLRTSTSSGTGPSGGGGASATGIRTGESGGGGSCVKACAGACANGACIVPPNGGILWLGSDVGLTADASHSSREDQITKQMSREDPITQQPAIASAAETGRRRRAGGPTELREVQRARRRAFRPGGRSRPAAGRRRETLAAITEPLCLLTETTPAMEAFRRRPGSLGLSLLVFA